MTQLFDLYLHTKGDVTSKPAFVMRAPLATISRYLSLHREAEARIVGETASDGCVCVLHDDRRWPGHFHVVTRAFDSLGAER